MKLSPLLGQGLSLWPDASFILGLSWSSEINQLSSKILWLLCFTYKCAAWGCDIILYFRWRRGKENIHYCWETTPNGAIIMDIRGQLGTILTLPVAPRTPKLIIDVETNIQMTVKCSNPHVARINTVHELKKHWVGCLLGQNFFLVAGKKKKKKEWITTKHSNTDESRNVEK